LSKQSRQRGRVDKLDPEGFKPPSEPSYDDVLARAMDQALKHKDPPKEMLLHCPECQKQHLDEGVWRHRVHRTHLCQHCGHLWRPFEFPTVGVAALPGT
jgi:hypothetical protein